MPKVRPLTAKQAADQEDKALSDAILNVVKEYRGRYDLLENDVCDRLGISNSVWLRWRREGLERVAFKSVLALVRFAGYELRLEKAQRTKKAQYGGEDFKRRYLRDNHRRFHSADCTGVH